MSHIRRLTSGGQRGQMLVITALMGVVLIGAAALAVDLSMQRNSHRYQQNWGDMAALSGVRACASACNAKTEVQDAFQVVLQNSPWSLKATTWASNAAASCTTTLCQPTAVAGPKDLSAVPPYDFSLYSVSISSPPLSPKNSAYSTTNYVQVDVSQTMNTNFGRVIGIPITHAISHSIAFSAGPPAPLPYAFYSKIHAGSGNQQESVVGDTFVGSGYQGQSSGQAGLCVYELSNDPDGPTRDNNVDDQGHVVFGGPGDPTTYPTLTSPAPPQPSYNNDMSLCAGNNAAGALLVQTVAPNVFISPAPNNCPVGATSLQNNTGTWICFQAPPPAPAVSEPDGTNGTSTRSVFTLPCAGAKVSGGAGGSTLPLGPGVYKVPAGCSVTIDFSSGNDINCVSLDLGVGSSVSVKDKKTEQFMTSYGYKGSSDGSSDSLAATAIGNLVVAGAHSAPAACPGASGDNSNSSVIYAAATNASPMPIALSNSSTGCCSDTLFIGTVFLPGQAVNFSSNQALEDVGSVYVGDWNVQSGAHPNPAVTRDPQSGALLRTDIRIVE